MRDSNQWPAERSYDHELQMRDGCDECYDSCIQGAGNEDECDQECGCQ